MSDTLLYCSQFPTPLGWVTAVASQAGLRSVRVADAAPEASLRSQHQHQHQHQHPHLAACQRQLADYFAGERQHFEVPLDAGGSLWQQRVWDALCAIPYGQTATYGQIAQRLNAPGAARAVGTANGRNPIWIIVPCHRVLGADGALTGYAGGLMRKRQLLDLERMNGAGSLFTGIDEVMRGKG